MKKRSRVTASRQTIGLDLGDKFSQVAVLDGKGNLVEQRRIKTCPIAFAAFFERYPGALVAFEAGAQSLWVYWMLKSMGCETLVANPRAIAALTKNERKCDKRDAKLLAELAYAKPSLLHPVQLRGPDVFADQCLLTARSGLVRCRTLLINMVRGMLKSVAVRVREGASASRFPKDAREVTPAELTPAIAPILLQIESLSQQIDEFEDKIQELIARYPETQRLQQVSGVGPLTALHFVFAIEDPKRFRKSRTVGAYFGLVPRKSQSGESDPELRITKTGNCTVRALLIQASQYILGPFGKDCDLRRHGMRIAAKGDKIAKRRAVVAVARKLAVLLHALWVSGTDYEALRTSPVAVEQIA